MLGWHFVGETLRDGRPIPADGEWLVHEGDIEPCETGLHMSVCPFDALKYAPGGTLCRVELDGDIVGHGNPVDKYVGRRRKILARIDATHLLRRFAADQALSVSHLWDMPAIVREYLETINEHIRAAARDAAWTAWTMATAAARSMARYAAMDASWSAARRAGYYSEHAARDAARKEFVKRVNLAFGIKE